MAESGERPADSFACRAKVRTWCAFLGHCSPEHFGLNIGISRPELAVDIFSASGLDLAGSRATKLSRTSENTDGNSTRIYSALCLCGLWQDLPDSPISSASVVKGLSKNRNLLALYAIWGAVFSYYFLATTASSRLRVLCALALIISVIGIIFTGSRTGLVVFSIVVAFLLVNRQASNRGIRALPVVVIVISLVGFGLVELGAVNSRLNLSERWENFTDIPNIVTSGSEGMGVRYETWRVAYLLWQQDPLVGIGPGRYRTEFRELSNLPRRFTVIVPHNTYMSLLAELGLFGLLTWIGLVLLTWREFARVRRSQFTSLVRLAAAWQTVLLATLVMGITHDLHTSKFIWLLFGLGIVLTRQYRIVLEGNKAQKGDITGRGDVR